MHDPMTVAHELKYPWKRKSLAFPEGYRDTFLTIWHVDPETDGTDSSCGWFLRARHGDKTVLEKIRRDFAFEWDNKHGGWFHADGRPRLSVLAITLNMFHRAAYSVFGNDWKKTDAFMRENLWDLMLFAENNVDTLHSGITMRYGQEAREDRITEFAGIVYGWILRASRPWWKHPRWHLHHWQLQCLPLQSFKRWAFSRCSKCGRGFSWGYCPVSGSWNSSGPRWFKSEENTYHGDCENPTADRIGAAVGA